MLMRLLGAGHLLVFIIYFNNAFTKMHEAPEAGITSLYAARGAAS